MQYRVLKSVIRVFFFILLLISQGCKPDPEKMLKEGLKNNDPGLVIQALDKGVDPQYRLGLVEYPDGTTSIDSKGKEISGIDYEQMPLLFWAISSNQSEVIKKLKEKGADFNYNYSNLEVQNLTPAKYCVLDQDASAETLEQLLQSGADPNVTYPLNSTNYSLLNIAILGESFKKAITLINNGANVNRLNSEDEAPVFSAIFTGNLEIINLLIDKGANLRVRREIDNKPPLFVAMDLNKIDIVREFLRRGIGIRDTYDGLLPQEYAMENGLDEIVDLIIITAD